MNILFMGTPEFAVASLRAIVDGGWKVTGVITQPDRPKGRGKKMQAPPVKVEAQKLGLRVFQPDRIKARESIELIAGIKPDVIVVVAYGQILPGDILKLPPLGCINVHASLLPQYRGAAPINWAIINGEKYTGITTMYMDEGLDTGDIILYERTEIGEEETAGQLHDRLAELGAQVLVRTLKAVEGGRAPRVPQDHSKATYAPQLSRKTGRINWKEDVIRIFNLIRGTDPWPGSYTSYKGKVMKIWKGSIIDKGSCGVPGSILEVGRDGFVVQTGRGRLLVEEIQMPSSRRMTVDEYIRGNTLEAGWILGDDGEDSRE